VDPDSRQIGIAAIAAPLAIMRNDLIEELCVLLYQIIALYKRSGLPGILSRYSVTLLLWDVWCCWDIVGRTDRQIIILYMCMVMDMLTDGKYYGYLEGNTSKLPLGVRILMFSPVVPQNAW